LKRLLGTWLRFNAVGLAGLGVQLASLEILLRVAGLDYLAASVIAVETAVLHNFLWHKHWTWAGHVSGETAGCWRLLGRFHLTHGAFSLGGALFFMPLLVGAAGLEPGVASLASTALGGLVSLASFFVLDRYVFIQRLGSRPGL
jgi:putative flippase GtrA